MDDGDIMGPFPPSRTHYLYLLIFQDMFTKCIECVPLRKVNGVNIQKAFEDCVGFRWGSSELLFTDNGTGFVNKFISKATKQFGIRYLPPPPSSNMC